MPRLIVITISENIASSYIFIKKTCLDLFVFPHSKKLPKPLGTTSFHLLCMHRPLNATVFISISYLSVCLSCRFLCFSQTLVSLSSFSLISCTINAPPLLPVSLSLAPLPSFRHFPPRCINRYPMRLVKQGCYLSLSHSIQGYHISLPYLYTLSLSLSQSLTLSLSIFAYPSLLQLARLLLFPIINHVCSQIVIS